MTVHDSDGPARPGDSRPGLVSLLSGRMRAMIQAGSFGTSGRIPPERLLARQLGASRGTVRKALQLLAEDGVVAAAAQSGWFATAAPLAEPPRQLMSFTEMARRRGSVPHTAVIHSHPRSATYEEAESFAQTGTEPVLDLERVRYLNLVPVCLDRSVIALSLAPGLEVLDLTDRSLYVELARRGETPTRSDFTIEAAAADERIAQALQIAPGSPVLIGTETCFDQFGRTLILGTSVYRANAYRFHATLTTRPS